MTHVSRPSLGSVTRGNNDKTQRERLLDPSFCYDVRRKRPKEPFVLCFVAIFSVEYKEPLGISFKTQSA